MLKVDIRVPSDLRFDDLRLHREENGDLSFDVDVTRRIAEESGLPPDFFMEQHEDLFGGVMIDWYIVARERGEPENPVMERSILESSVESDGAHRLVAISSVKRAH